MLIKTEEFDNYLHARIDQIKIDKRKNLVQRGSYRIKPFGSLITDFDTTQYVRFNPFLIKSIVSMIKGLKDFVFMGIFCGTFDEFVLPWKIDGEGDCFYEPKKTKEWFDRISKLIPPELAQKVSDKLFSQDLSLKDLIDIRGMLRQYWEISWSVEDIEHGKLFNGKRYYLLDTMKKGQLCVVRFVMLYKKDAVQVEMTIIDDMYTKQPFIIRQHYGRNLYKIFKSIKWYIPNSVRPSYAVDLNSMEWYPAIIDRIKLLKLFEEKKNVNQETVENIRQDIKKSLEEKKYSPDKDDPSFSQIEKTLTKELYTKSEELTKKYRRLIDPNHKDEVDFYFLRAKQSLVPISQSKLVQRTSKGIRCPFFDVQIDDFNFLWNLADKALVDREKLMTCVVELSNMHETDISLLIQRIFPKNSLEIKVGKNAVYLHDKSKNTTQAFPLEKLPQLQATVLFSRIP